MRIFLGPIEVAGFYTSLRRGLEAEGVAVMFAVLSPDWRGYAYGEQSPLVRAVCAVIRVAAAVPPADRLRRRIMDAAVIAARLVLLAWAVIRCDAFIFASGNTITWYTEWELRVLRRLRKRVVFSFHGSDSRPPYLGSRLMSGLQNGTPADCAAQTAEIKALLRRIHPYADAVVVNPFSAHLHPGPCINAQALGNPAPPPAGVVSSAGSEGGAVRVLHSPSLPELKGTDIIRAAIAAVQARGRDIEYVELAFRPHTEVLAELARCDFVIDQAYSDTPMALFATEAGAFGKPAVVGGYISPEQMAANLRPEWMPPVLYCHPTALADAIERLCTDVQFRRRLGEEARAFVLQERHPRAVARRFLRLVRGDVPDDWWFDPREIEYVHGLGEEAHVRRLIRDVVAYGGVAALQVDDSPTVRARLLAFAGLDAYGRPAAGGAGQAVAPPADTLVAG